MKKLYTNPFEVKKLLQDDMKKYPKAWGEGKMILWIVILMFIFFGGSHKPKLNIEENTKSHPAFVLEASADMTEWEDYSSEIGKFDFGDHLLATIREFNAPKLIKMHKHSAYQEMVYNRMYWRNPDINMLATFKGEGGQVRIDQPSNGVGFDGYRGWGFCQLYYTYHKEFIDGPDFMDWRKQVDRCVSVWKDAESRGILKSTFQAYPKRQALKSYFEIL